MQLAPYAKHAFFARGHYAAISNNVYYIAIVEEGTPILKHVYDNGPADDYFEFDYPLTVVENLRGELPLHWMSRSFSNGKLQEIQGIDKSSGVFAGIAKPENGVLIFG